MAVAGLPAGVQAPAELTIPADKNAAERKVPLGCGNRPESSTAKEFVCSSDLI
ncbi:MAG TPA: hypothetical protein VHC19_14135 [Pirellulales bacterium]|nr:hypothetical protein [Pirellulales bacterium]